jgi:hypothetical protein
MKQILWKYGIRFDVLENKQERASISEVVQSSSYFDSIDNERRQCRLNFIKWCIRNWSDDAIKVDYEFFYGRIG